MLSACFDRHTRPALMALSPDAVVLLRGAPAHEFRRVISTLLPNAQLFSAPQYAHRQGREVEKIKTAEVRRFIANFKR
jgi:hypothetical protein